MQCYDALVFAMQSYDALAMHCNAMFMMQLQCNALQCYDALVMQCTTRDNDKDKGQDNENAKLPLDVWACCTAM